MAVITYTEKTYAEIVEGLTANERGVLYSLVFQSETHRYDKYRRSPSPESDLARYRSETARIPHKQIWTALDRLVAKGLVEMTKKGETIDWVATYATEAKPVPVADLERRSRNAGSSHWDSRDQIEPERLYEISVPRADEIRAAVERDRAAAENEAALRALAARDEVERRETKKVSELLDLCRSFVEKYGDGASPFAETPESYRSVEADSIVREIEYAAKALGRWEYERSEIEREARSAEKTIAGEEA